MSISSVKPTRLLGVAAIFLGTAVAARAAHWQSKATSAPAAQAAQQSEEELARVGEELTTKICDTACHGLEKLDELRRTPREWNDVIVSMLTRGAAGTDQELSTVRKYLARYYGIVAVNIATADDLAAVLGLTPKDAAAIVAYRTSHGKFADVNALLKVPGIDKAKIEEQPDALRFN